MAHIREAGRVMGAENLEIILKDVDGGKITVAQMDSFAGHEAMADIVGGKHRRRTREGKGVSDRAEMSEMFSDWYESENAESGWVHWRSQQTIMKKIIVIFGDPNVRCYPLAGKLKKANPNWVNICTFDCIDSSVCV